MRLNSAPLMRVDRGPRRSVLISPLAIFRRVVTGCSFAFAANCLTVRSTPSGNRTCSKMSIWAPLRCRWQASDRGLIALEFGDADADAPRADLGGGKLAPLDQAPNGALAEAGQLGNLRDRKHRIDRKGCWS